MCFSGENQFLFCIIVELCKKTSSLVSNNKYKYFKVSPTTNDSIRSCLSAVLTSCNPLNPHGALYLSPNKFNTLSLFVNTLDL